jgi:hypothetical protein
VVSSEEAAASLLATLLAEDNDAILGGNRQVLRLLGGESSTARNQQGSSPNVRTTRMVSRKQSGKKLGYRRVRRSRGREGEGRDRLTSRRLLWAAPKGVTPNPSPGECVDN